MPEEVERDPCWEKVRAFVGKPLQKYFPSGTIKFEIEVQVGEQIVGHRTLVAVEDLQTYPETYDFVLNKMVSLIDEALQQKDVT